MTAPSSLSLSKSLEKGISTTTRCSASTDSKGSQRARTATRRSSGVVGQNVRAVVRNRLAERKGNNLSASQHKAPASVGGSSQSTPSITSLSPKHQRKSVSTRSSSSINSTSNHRGDSRSTVEMDSSPKKGSRPGSVSKFLKSTHRQLKAEIAKIQDKIIFLCVLSDWSVVHHPDYLCLLTDTFCLLAGKIWHL
jgi:hypothetical protein